MCGICGIYDTLTSADNKQAVIDGMLKVQHHRGPDGSFSWQGEHDICFGHNRLKIIDLSDDANQPMHYMHYSIVFNGEVYNYLEIRETLIKAGYTFRTASDTEVILAAYAAWGEACVERFVGMWAFAIWDAKEQALFCSRDRFGIKPFYYINDNGRFYFASEYKTLKETPVFVNKLNNRQFKRALLLGWMAYNDETLYECIKQLPPATNLLITGKRFVYNRYWELQKNMVKLPSGVTPEEHFADLFNDAIKLHMRSDVNVGGCLSGGLDSSAIASVICKTYPDVNFKTFNVYYEGDGNVDERFFVKEVVRKYPNITPFYYTPTPDLLQEAFDKAMYHADIPIGDSSYLSQYFLMQLAANNDVRVVIDGQGADEYLAGYMHSFYRLIAMYLRKAQPLKALGLMRAQINRQDFGAGKASMLMLKSLVTLFYGEQSVYKGEYNMNRNKVWADENDTSPLFDLPTLDKDNFHTFLYNLIFYTSLPTLLHYVDRNSMTFSLESRVPFLDHRLIEFVFSLPFEYKISATAETKAVMRHALKDVLPEAIYNRRDKKGFVTPGDTEWLRGPLKDIVNIDYERASCFNKQKMEAILSAFRKGDNTHSRLVWKTVVAHEWLKRNGLGY